MTALGSRSDCVQGLGVRSRAAVVHLMAGSHLEEAHWGR